ncbi:MAG: tRNA uridine-5-carboxymethylaminomethyl(34) synthesis GTPase MnmE [Alphaproteobacteria bacterium]|jgi:tRNA modification GTPase|nr:tRNA uridine-5-carboxymethylaminomethyl(34) synthesis GTPase MnmE [Alphaproteobacteria bacterium]PPR14057.1 MAG: tRNA modification GTPase MnmE [Alphaproteobacteria bacterium MarineAlpha12_Bin1]|tara:strand:- start:27959 stop:29290 length:1332 start_codon:yes stop_codon:yes gene_type:complete
MIDTIYSLSTGAGSSGVAIIRLSGPASEEVLKKLTRKRAPEPRLASLRRIHNPIDQNAIDEGIVIWFPGPNSYTGEDVVEFHVHGGPSITEEVLKSISTVASCRIAEPGEFTRRAFQLGKMDLTSAEAVADLIDAKTIEQRRQALKQFDGQLAGLYDEWRKQLIDILAYAESAIDFSDEELPEGINNTITNNILYLINNIAQHIDDKKIGERIRSGFNIAILGAPNSGKSSLLNRLATRDVAIVSDTAGTTRDVIEVQMNLEGFAVIVSDTAGIRDTQNEIEFEGVRRARKAADEADLVVVVFDALDLPDISEITKNYISDKSLVLVNKVDLLDHSLPGEINGKETLGISAKTGEGFEEFQLRLNREVKNYFGNNEQPVLTRERHRKALEDTLASLNRSTQAVLPELVAEDIRLAVRSIGKITGRVDVEDVLDIIFGEFCIGK